jgi:hypothetical protein
LVEVEVTEIAVSDEDGEDEEESAEVDYGSFARGLVHENSALNLPGLLHLKHQAVLVLGLAVVYGGFGGQLVELGATDLVSHIGFVVLAGNFV